MDIAKYSRRDMRIGIDMASVDARDMHRQAFLIASSHVVQILPIYPCNGCVWAALCNHTGQVCNAWRRWFTANYDHAARQLRAAAQQRRANGESD